MISFGITGIIGSGKSMLSQIFRAMNVPVYDADTNAKRLMEKDLQVKGALVHNFGTNTYTNGKINKDYLREIIFRDESNRQLVNSIVHPAVKRDFIEWRKHTNKTFAAIESAILFEAKINDILNCTIYVEAPEDIIIKRICKRDNVSEQTAIKKINIQKKNSGRDQCEYIFINDKNHSLIEQAEKFINDLNK